jgi:hypothetical protein
MKNPFSSLQAAYGSWTRLVPLLPSGPDGVPRQPIAYDLEINAEGVTERVGFEPTVPLRVHTPSKRAPSTTRSSLLETTDGLKAFAYCLRTSWGRSAPTRTGMYERTPRKHGPPGGPRTKNGSRREWDSNPRSPDGLNGFRDRPIRPLSHLSLRHGRREIIRCTRTRTPTIKDPWTAQGRPPPQPREADDRSVPKRI